MPFVPFPELFLDVAKQETRSITIPPFAGVGLPVDTYEFIEMYCDEPACDCRRVMFTVLSLKQPRVQAVIAWGWETTDFYKRWLRSNDPVIAKELQGPVLNLGGPQSENAEALLKVTHDILLADPAYIERIKRHYAMFRSKIEQRSGKRKKKRRKK